MTACWASGKHRVYADSEANFSFPAGAHGQEVFGCPPSLMEAITGHFAEPGSRRDRPWIALP